MDNAIDLLKRDHQLVKELFARIEETEEDDADERKELFEQLSRALAAHETIEGEIFYPAAKEAGEEVEETVSHSFQEHHVADLLADEIAALKPDDEEWAAKAHVLKEMVEHHIEEEEGELFPEVEDALGDERLAELGQQMLARKEEVEAERNPRATAKKATAREVSTKSVANRGRSSAASPKRKAPAKKGGRASGGGRRTASRR